MPGIPRCKLEHARRLLADALADAQLHLHVHKVVQHAHCLREHVVHAELQHDGVSALDHLHTEPRGGERLDLEVTSRQSERRVERGQVAVPLVRLGHDELRGPDLLEEGVVARALCQLAWADPVRAVETRRDAGLAQARAHRAVYAHVAHRSPCTTPRVEAEEVARLALQENPAAAARGGAAPGAGARARRPAAAAVEPTEGAAPTLSVENGYLHRAHIDQVREQLHRAAAAENNLAADHT